MINFCARSLLKKLYGQLYLNDVGDVFRKDEVNSLLMSKKVK